MGEGEVGNEADQRTVEVFRFKVDENGEITMGRLSDPMPQPTMAPMAMKAMKVMKAPMRVAAMKKAMKAMVMKKPMKKVSTVARGKKGKVQVYQGKKLKTKKGLTKDSFKKNKEGHIVSIRKSEQAKRSKWAKATAKARAIKGYIGFKAIKKGGSFYEKAKEIMSEM